MSAQHVTVTSVDGRLTVIADGVDIGPSVRGVDVHAEHGHAPRIVVHLDPGVGGFSGLADVGVSERLAAALVALGWAPPAGTGAGR